MAAFLWRTISKGYRDSLEKNISTRKQLHDVREICKFTIFQQEANLESQIEKLGKGPQGQSHDQWAQTWIGVLISSKEISNSIWTEQRIYREFVKISLTFLPAFGEKLKAKIIETDASKLKLNEAVRQYSAWASFGIPQTRTSFKGVFATLDEKNKMLKLINRRVSKIVDQRILKAIKTIGKLPFVLVAKDIISTSASISMFHNLEIPIKVCTGDSNCFIIGTGSIRLAVNADKGQRYLWIDNAQHISGFHINIIAYKAFKHGGAYLDGKKNWIPKVKDDRCVAICETSPSSSFLVLENKKSDLLLKTSFATNSSEQKVYNATAERWHLRLGHMSHENIHHVSQNVDGVKVTDMKKRDNTNEKNILYEVCNIAYKGETPFQWTHINLIHEEPGLSNERYIFHFYCQLTKFNIAYVTSDRKQKTLVNCFAQAHDLINKWGFYMQFIRVDQEAGLQSEFNDYCAKHSIWHEKTPTDIKEPNRATKRSGGWIITKALGYKTPFELVTKRRPDLSGYRIPGSKFYVTKKNIPALQKQATRSDIGYYIPNSSRDIRAYEMSHFSWENVRNLDITPVIEDRFVSIENGNPIDQPLEDVIEESPTFHNQADNENIHINTNPLSESTDKTQTDFHGNLPTTRATPEISNEGTISRETSHEKVEDSENKKRPHNRRLTEVQVLEGLRETSREARARRRNQRKENLNFYLYRSYRDR
ncbi:hypothetical protein HI914_02554 [Erysiphe necator]|nr:hypothetical protein HI914_02554 [Erysiphe necator]